MEIFNFKRRKILIINFEVSSLIRPLQSSISYGDKQNKVKSLASIFVTQICLKSNTILYKLLSTKIQILNLCSDSSILHIEEIKLTNSYFTFVIKFLKIPKSKTALLIMDLTPFWSVGVNKSSKTTWCNNSLVSRATLDRLFTPIFTRFLDEGLLCQKVAQEWS